ncbi:MAG TPA: phosphatidylserine decarboxylase [Vicinamibacterales bacterium]
MRIDPAGWPFVIAGFVVAALVGAVAGLAWGLVACALPAFFLFFFRDPERLITAGVGTVLSPADGTVMVVGAPIGDYAGTDWQQVSIFLSPLNVHVNRMPIGGRVTRVRYHPGRFLPAYRREAGDLNEYTEVTLDVEGRQVVVRQIVGVLARRIVCRVQEGDLVTTGARFGVMKFGSRMDVFLPPTAGLHVRVGERVVGGVSVIATLGEQP